MHLRTSALVLFLSAVFAHSAHAGGYLWLGSEYQGEGNVYRFNLTTRSIDRIVSPLPPSEHWNNVTIVGDRLFLGTPNTNTLTHLNAYTGDDLSPGAYSGTLSGLKEDGAYHDGSLWRMTYTGARMHRTTVAGVIETTFTVPSGLVGIEFVNGRAYASSFTTARVGRLNRSTPTSWTFAALPWKGAAPSGDFGALAYDADADSLYLATRTPALYRIEIVNDSARAVLAANLVPAGYPSGGLPDGLGWLPPATTAAPPPPRDGTGLLELGEPFPNPAREAVWFAIHAMRSMPLEVGIFDLGGRRLRSWSLPAFGPGRSQLMWDLRDASGRIVAPGRYHVRITSGDARVSRSFVRVE